MQKFAVSLATSLLQMNTSDNSKALHWYWSSRHWGLHSIGQALLPIWQPWRRIERWSVWSVILLGPCRTPPEMGDRRYLAIDIETVKEHVLGYEGLQEQHQSKRLTIFVTCHLSGSGRACLSEHLSTQYVCLRGPVPRLQSVGLVIWTSTYIRDAGRR